MMSTVIRTVAMLLLLGSAPALAATGSQKDSAIWYVYGFLGLCALIIVAQLAFTWGSAPKKGQDGKEHH